jgi:hypothetical protein
LARVLYRDFAVGACASSGFIGSGALVLAFSVLGSAPASSITLLGTEGSVSRGFCP